MTMNEELTPQIAKEEVNAIVNKDILADEDYTQIFIIMLRHEFPSITVFKEFIDNISTDMEIYGIIDDAKKVKTWVNGWAAKDAASKANNATILTAIKMAIASDSAAGRQYVEAEKAEHDAISAIMEAYETEAHQAIMNMLQRNLRKAIMMHGPNANKLASIIKDMIEKNS